MAFTALDDSFLRFKQWAGQIKRQAVWTYLPRFLLALLSLGLLTIATWPITWPADGMSLILPEGRISSVAPGSPADRIGLQAGDIVLAIDDHAPALAPLFAGYRGDQQVLITFRHGDLVRQVTITLTPPSVLDLLGRSVPVLVGLSFWIMGLLVFGLRPLKPVCQAFFLFSQAAALVLATGQLSAVNLGRWATPLFYLSLFALTPLLANLYMIFAWPTSSLIKIFPKSLIVLSAVLAGLQVNDFITMGSGYTSQWRLIARAYPGVILVIVTLGLVRAYMTTSTTDLRQRIRALAFGTVVGFAPLVLLSIVPDVLNLPGLPHIPYQATFLFLVLVPITHAYAIIAHDLAPLDRLFNRSLVVFLLSLLWSGVYLVGVELGLALTPDISLLAPIVGGLVTILVIVFVEPLKRRLQQIVDRLFYGGWYDYYSVVSRISSSLASVLTPEELASQLVRPLVEALRLQGGALYLAGSDPAGSLCLQTSIGLTLPEQLVNSSALVAWLTQHGTLISARTITLKLGLQSIQQAWLDAEAVPRGETRLSFLLPLVREGRLLGLLLLGARRDDDFGESAEHDILMTLVGPTTLAVHNVLLVSDLRHTLSDLEAARDALQQAHRQILGAREDERARLAWDLHDGPVQDVIALGYRLFNSRIRASDLSPELALEIETARQEANRLSIVLRNICTELRSEVLDLSGLGPEIRRHAYDIQQATSLKIELDVPRFGPKLADPLGITLFRIYREAISNIIRHAQASIIQVHFHLDSLGTYELVVRDNGQGFTVPANLDTLARAQHFGLFDARERITSVGGYLSVRSDLQKGTVVKVWGRVQDAAS